MYPGLNVPLHRRQGFGVAFHTHPGSQASSRGEAKDSTLFSSRDRYLLEPPERPLLIATGEAIPLRGLEGVPGLPGAPQDEAGLTRKFETSHVWWAAVYGVAQSRTRLKRLSRSSSNAAKQF